MSRAYSASEILVSPLKDITLRSLDPSHAPTLLTTASPHQPWLPQFGLGPLTLDAMEEFCQYGKHSSALGHGLMAGIWTDGQLIGHVGTHSRDCEHHSGELSCWIAPQHQRKGAAFIAAKLALHHAFTVIGMHSVQAVVAPHNLPAQKLLGRLKFVPDAICNIKRADGTTMVCQTYSLAKPNQP